MTDFTYTVVAGKLPQLFEKTRDVGPPEKVTVKWLESVGFKSKNDRSLLRVLEQIEFLDDSRVPTERWKQYRGAQSRKVLAEGIRQGYGDLFKTYPNAHSRSFSDLENYFATHSDYSKKTVGRVVQTFRALCELADFDGTGTGSPPGEEDPESEGNGKGGGPGPGFPNVGINVNVQLVLPDGADAKAYDALFAAMRKHLFPEGTS